MLNLEAKTKLEVAISAGVLCHPSRSLVDPRICSILHKKAIELSDSAATLSDHLEFSVLVEEFGAIKITSFDEFSSSYSRVGNFEWSVDVFTSADRCSVLNSSRFVNTIRFEVSTTKKPQIYSSCSFHSTKPQNHIAKKHKKKSRKTLKENENEPPRYCAQFTINGETKKSKNLKLLRSWNFINWENFPFDENRRKIPENIFMIQNSSIYLRGRIFHGKLEGCAMKALFILSFNSAQLFRVQQSTKGKRFNSAQSWNARQ